MRQAYDYWQDQPGSLGRASRAQRKPRHLSQDANPRKTTALARTSYGERARSDLPVVRSNHAYSVTEATPQARKRKHLHDAVLVRNIQTSAADVSHSPHNRVTSTRAHSSESSVHSRHPRSVSEATLTHRATLLHRHKPCGERRAQSINAGEEAPPTPTERPVAPPGHAARIRGGQATRTRRAKVLTRKAAQRVTIPIYLRGACRAPAPHRAATEALESGESPL